MWAAGIAAGAVPVALWRIVGPGFHRLAAGSAALIGAGVLIFDPGPGTIVGLVLLAVSVLITDRPMWLAIAFAVSAAGFLTSAFSAGEILPAITGALTLGAVTDEMLLGHWYLVDPRLPRWALKSLDGAAAVGLVADIGILVGRGALTWKSEAFVVGWAFVGLALMSALLLIGVWFALRERGYNGVMAATGLSYLAVLTVIGATISGRSLVGEGSGLLSG
jgi:hypothetical protein